MLLISSDLFLAFDIFHYRYHHIGLPSHPQHEIAKKQQSGYGGMITFWLKGGLEQSRAFLEQLKIFALAESLGGVESLAEHPYVTSLIEPNL